MNIFKWIEYKNLKNHITKTNSHIGSLSASGIENVPNLVYDMRIILDKISEKIDKNYIMK